MVQSCCAYNCSERATLNSGYSFHRFPLNNEDLLKEWCLALRRRDFEPRKFSRICSKHFTEDSYEPGLKFRKLKKNAIPTIFDFGKSKLHQRKSKARRHEIAAAATYKKFISSKQSTEDVIDDERIENVSSASENESDHEERVTEIIKLTNYQNNGPTREYNTDSEISNDCDKDYVGGSRSSSPETNSNNDNVEQYDTSKMSQQKQIENEKLRQTILLLHKRMEKFMFLVECLRSTDMISEEAAFVLKSTMDM